MDRKPYVWILCLIGLTLLLVACSSSESATATAPATPTAVLPTEAPSPAPTAIPPTEAPPPTSTTIAPTEAPHPTSTAVPPTETPPPTSTSAPPTDTPAPTSGLPEADGAAVVEYVLDGEPYETWGTWPADEWNDFDQFLESGEPHGNVVRIFVNDVALEAAAASDFDGTLPPGSIVLKENYMGTDPADPGELDALTIMYKVEGFNAEANDWFWVKAAGDGSAIDAEGAVGGCIGCHGQENNRDYLLRYAFGEEPAVPSPGSEETGEEPEVADIRPPEQLYQELGCTGCHNVDQDQTDANRGQIGPNHGNLNETAENRVPGQDAETYVYTSIVDPMAHIVDGYEPIMPQDFAEKMSEEEIQGLVDWLLDPDRGS